MKKILYSFLLLTFISYSCDDFVTPNPKDRITPEIALENLNGVEAFLFAAYNKNIGFNYYGNNLTLVGDVLADNLVLSSGTRFNAEVVNGVGAFRSLWTDPSASLVDNQSSLYSIINDANLVIENAERLRDEDAARADILIGEAKFIRALNYHDLARVYSYEPGQEVNGFNAGVILRTEPVTGASGADLRTRSTNVEVYAQIEADLLDAIAKLPAEASQASAPNRASIASARALLSRVYLYEGSYAEAATQADAALAATSSTLVDAANYVTSFATAVHPESIFELAVSQVDWSGVDGVNNSLTTFTKSVAGGAPASSQGAVKASAELLATFEAGDVRRDLFEDPTGQGNFESNKWPGEGGNFLENIPVIRVSEVLLIAAEGKARSGNEAGALADINRLRTNRGLAASTASGAALIDLILKERRVELCLEGHRFFDLKRLGLVIPKPAILGVPNLGVTDFRRLARIPVAEIVLAQNQGGGLIQNPGY